MNNQSSQVVREEDLSVGGVEYHQFHAQVLNVTSSRKQLENMLNVAWGAYAQMKANGETSFDVSIASHKSDYSLEKVAKEAYQRFFAIAHELSRKRVPVAAMTEEEKFSIAVACGVPLERMENAKGLLLDLRTKPCGIVMDDDGVATGQPAHYRAYVKA